jgi:hypothetical protein
MGYLFMISNLVFSVLKRILYLNTAVIFIKNLTDKTEDIMPSVPFELKMATEVDIPDLLSMDNRYSLREFRSLLREGERVFFGYSNDSLVYRCSVTIGPKVVNILYNFLSYPIAQGEVLVHYCKTRKDFRKKGIYSSSLIKLEKILYKQFNVKKMIIVTTSVNEASIRGIKKAGYQKKCRIRIINILGARLKYEYQ